MCHTSNVSTACCRHSDNQDGHRVLADGTNVPSNSGNAGFDFSRSGFTHQLQLNCRNNALVPTGNFTCMVPDMDGLVIHREVITLIVGE